MARIEGIDPSTMDLESIILPLNYTHIIGCRGKIWTYIAMVMSHLSYHFSTLQYHLKTYIKLKFYWLWGQDLNLRMDESKSSAFTNFATPQYLDWLLVISIFFTWVTILFLLHVRTLTRIFKCNLIKLETSDC